MFKYYKIATIIPFIVIVVCYFLLGIIDFVFWYWNISIPNYNYKESIVIYSFAIPYFIGLCWSFILFCKEKEIVQKQCLK